jgi:flagellar protein FlbT
MDRSSSLPDKDIDMALRIDLGPGEKLFVGRSIITNGNGRSAFAVDGDGAVLRARDAVSEPLCSTSISRLYACIQRMYLYGSSGETTEYSVNVLAACTQGLLSPDAARHLNELVSKDPYKALKLLRPLLPSQAFLAPAQAVRA